MANQYSILRGMEARAETQRQELHSETAAAAEARSRLADLPLSPQKWSGAMPFGQAPANLAKQPPFPPQFIISTPERDHTMEFQSLPSSPLPATVRPLVGSESGAQVSSGYEKQMFDRFLQFQEEAQARAERDREMLMAAVKAAGQRVRMAHKPREKPPSCSSPCSCSLCNTQSRPAEQI
jgi:hypothetical protein